MRQASPGFSAPEEVPLHAYQIADTEFVVCDVETTGLSPERNRLTEIALVRIRGGEIVDRYSSLVNPRQFIPPEITRLTGISNEMVYAAPEAAEVLPVAKRFIGDAVFVGHNVRFDRSFVDTTLLRIGGSALQSPMLCTARLARRLMPKKSKASLGVLAAQYGIRINNRHRAGGDAEATARLLLMFLNTLEEEFDVTELGELLTFQNRQIYRITGAPKYYTRLEQQLAELPHLPGVYFFHGKKGEVLYIGKARNLKQRVSSYFYHNIGHTEKIRRLLRSVHGISWKQTETELSALLTESRLIKQYQPDYNTRLKRYRRYPFIRVSMQDEWPRVDWCYDINDDGAEYFGPFRSRFAVEDALDSINKLFGLRECGGAIRPDPAANPCLYYDIKRCSAPCADLVSREEYLREVGDVIRFMQGEHDHVMLRFRERMQKKSDALDFEGAAALRDRIQALERMIRQQRVMVHSVRKQNLAIVTLARGSNVEVHFIKGGMLAAQFLVDQKRIVKKDLLDALRDIYAGRQTELFGGRIEDIDEMRIIASWCLTRRDESTYVDIDTFPKPDDALEPLCELVRCAGWTVAEERVAECEEPNV
jgi:DNA polymerase III subunit epsilon